MHKARTLTAPFVLAQEGAAYSYDKQVRKYQKKRPSLLKGYTEVFGGLLNCVPLYLYPKHTLS